MRTNMKTSGFAMACIVLGTAGAIFHASSPQAAAISPPQKKGDMCVVAASFELDAAGRRVAGVMRDGFGCASKRAS